MLIVDDGRNTDSPVPRAVMVLLVCLEIVDGVRLRSVARILDGLERTCGEKSSESMVAGCKLPFESEQRDRLLSQTMIFRTSSQYPLVFSSSNNSSVPGTETNIYYRSSRDR